MRNTERDIKSILEEVKTFIQENKSIDDYISLLPGLVLLAVGLFFFSQSKKSGLRGGMAILGIISYFFCIGLGITGKTTLTFVMAAVTLILFVCVWVSKNEK